MPASNQSSIHELDCWKKDIQEQSLRCHIVFFRENKVEEKWRLANLFAAHAHGLKLKTMNWYQLFQYQQGSNPIPPSASEPQWTPQVYPKGSDSQDWKKWTLRRLRIQAAEEEYLKVISGCQFDDFCVYQGGLGYISTSWHVNFLKLRPFWKRLDAVLNLTTRYFQNRETPTFDSISKLHFWTF